MSRKGDDGFLSRWSRRKAAARAPESVAPPDALPEASPEPPSASQLDDAVRDHEVDEAYVSSLPPVESITAATDLAPFLRKGVPAVLRNAALRRMWSADPLIRDHLDVARDYYWDWNAPGGVPGGGGSLSPAAVATMARGIRGVPEPEPEAKVAAAPDPDAPAHDIAGPGTAPEDHRATERPLPDGASEAEARAPRAAPPDDDPLLATRQDTAPVQSGGLRKKHGGAVPE